MREPLNNEPDTGPPLVPMLSRRARSNLRFLAVATPVSALIGGSVGALRSLHLLGAVNPAFVAKGTVLAVLMAVACGGLNLFVLVPALRRARFAVAVAIKALVLTLVTVALFVWVSWLFRATQPMDVQMAMLGPAIVITLLAASISLFALELERLVGRRVLLAFFTGRYHHPVEEERILMFADLVGSTTIAERIGHVRFHRLLRDLFFDVSDVVAAHGGEIYKYVGDEVIVVWPVGSPAQNGRCLSCACAVEATLEAQRARYERDYGVAPRFRTGIHAGVVVVGEIGDQRKEIAFLGDTINTAARVQAEAKAKQADTLVSADLVARVALPTGVTLAPVGATQLRGKVKPLELYAVVPGPPPVDGVGAPASGGR